MRNIDFPSPPARSHRALRRPRDALREPPPEGTGPTSASIVLPTNPGDPVMTDIIHPPRARAESSEPIIDPDLRPLAEATLAALQVTTEAVLARRARPVEFPAPAVQSHLEQVIDAELGRRDRAVQNRAGLAALASLSAPREERRRRFGALGELDMRGRGLADALERMPAAPL